VSWLECSPWHIVYMGINYCKFAYSIHQLETLVVIFPSNLRSCLLDVYPHGAPVGFRGSDGDGDGVRFSPVCLVGARAGICSRGLGRGWGAFPRPRPAPLPSLAEAKKSPDGSSGSGGSSSTGDSVKSSSELKTNTSIGRSSSQVYLSLHHSFQHI
jgi:hypothetical protein